MSAIVAALANFFFACGKVLDTAVSYAGSAVNGATLQIKSTPSRIRLKVVVSGGTFSSNDIVATLHTSPDGTTFVSSGKSLTFTANATQEIEVDVALMPYIRFAYSGAASGTILSVFLANNDPDQVVGNAVHEVEDANPVNGFVFCNVANALDASLAVPSTAGGTAYNIQDDSLHAGFLVVTVASRTVGSVAPKVQFTVDGGTTWIDSGDALSAISANGTSIVKISRGVAKRFRVHYTSASSFDGRVTTSLYGDGLVAAV